MHELDQRKRKRNARRVKTRKPPALLGDCKPGDEVLVRVQVTAFINGGVFGRVIDARRQRSSSSCLSMRPSSPLNGCGKAR